MPSVPRYDSQQVGQAAIPNARLETNAPIEAFGGGQAAAQATQATIGLSQQAFKLAQDEKDRADDTMVKDLYSKAVMAKNRAMYDKDTGAMNRRGKDAFGVVDEYGESFDKELLEIEKEAKNDAQRELFNGIKSKLKLELSENLQKHTFVESEKYEDEVNDSALAAAREDGLMNYQNPGKIAESINMQKSIIMSQAGPKGLSDEWVQNKLKEVSSKTNSAIVSRLLANGQDIEAKNYFNENKDSFQAQDAAKIELDLQEGSLRGETQRQATEIMRSSGGDLKRALEAARSVTEPKLQESLVSEIKVRYAENEKIETERNEKRFDAAALYAEKKLERPEPGVWNSLSLQERNSIDNRIAQLRRGEEPEQNSEDYYNLMQMASGVDKDGFLKTNLRVYKGKITDSELASMIKMQTDLRAGKGSDELDGFRSDQSIVNDALAAADIDPTPKPGSADSKKVAQFRKAVDDQVRVLQKRTGKKATNEEIQSITDNLMVKGPLSNSGVDIPFFGKIFKSEKRIFELEDGDEISVTVKDIPPLEKQKIEAALRNNGIPVTNKSIIEVYSKKVLNRGGG